MSPNQVTKNKAVYFTYIIRDEQGSEVERCDIPVGYIHGGSSDLLPKVEEKLEGKSEGDQVEVTLTPKEAFGEHNPDLTYTDSLENVPEQYRHVGAEVEFQNDRGETKTFFVSSISDGELTVDGNHPLAGKTITFALVIVEVRDATSVEIENGISQIPETRYLH